jgi:SAM-dependent methyltransferase
MELLAGCGSNRDQKIRYPGATGKWQQLVTLDMNPDHKPDVVHDLTVLPYPFADDTFESVNLYDVLEHMGQQGDYKAFFAQFSEFWRILKPGGYLAGVSPYYSSPWAWGDPGHSRVIGPECLTFLDQDQYVQQVGNTPLTDYRFCYRADFECVHSEVMTPLLQHVYILQAIKPSRWARPSPAPQPA